MVGSLRGAPCQQLSKARKYRLIPLLSWRHDAPARDSVAFFFCALHASKRALQAEGAGRDDFMARILDRGLD